MTTFAIICASLLAGYLAGAITGFYIGKEITEAPEVLEPDDTVRPAVVNLPLYDKKSGKPVHNSCFFYAEDRADGGTKQHIIQIN